MRVSPLGIAFIANEEGLRLDTYLDFAGHLTVGYGHLVQPSDNLKLGNRITKERAEALLKSDLARFELAVSRYVAVGLNSNQFDALVSLVFNIGVGNFNGSTLQRKLNQGDYAGAAAEFPKWRLANGKPHAILEARRKREQKLFLKPVQALPVDPRYDFRTADPLHLEEAPIDVSDPYGLKRPGER